FNRRVDELAVDIKKHFPPFHHRVVHSKFGVRLRRLAVILAVVADIANAFNLAPVLPVLAVPRTAARVLDDLVFWCITHQNPHHCCVVNLDGIRDYTLRVSLLIQSQDHAVTRFTGGLHVAGHIRLKPLASLRDQLLMGLLSIAGLIVSYYSQRGSHTCFPLSSPQIRFPMVRQSHPGSSSSTLTASRAVEPIDSVSLYPAGSY